MNVWETMKLCKNNISKIQSLASHSTDITSCSFSSDQFPSFYRPYRFLVCKMAVPNSKTQDIMSIRMVTELTVDNISCFVISWILMVNVKAKCVTNDIPEHSLYACTHNIVQKNSFRLYLNMSQLIAFPHVSICSYIL